MGKEKIPQMGEVGSDSPVSLGLGSLKGMASFRAFSGQGMFPLEPFPSFSEEHKLLSRRCQRRQNVRRHMLEDGNRAVDALNWMSSQATSLPGDQQARDSTKLMVERRVKERGVPPPAFDE